MKHHRYRVTVEYLSSATGVQTSDAQFLRFETCNHDEILGLVERVKAHGSFDDEEAAAFVVGLKLLGEVVLNNKEKPLFEDFLPHFGVFMKQLKQGTP